MIIRKEADMDVTTSYAVELLHFKNAAMATIRIYRNAVSFLVNAAEKEWSSLREIPVANARMNYLQALIHTTKNHIAVYDFDSAFPKMPAYLRRNAIITAIGAVSSYHSNYDSWVLDGKVGNPPKLTADRFLMPCFYRDNMYLGDLSSDTAYLKLFVGNDWIWYPVRLKHTDMQYLRKNWTGVKCSAPTIEKRHGRWFLRFAFQTKVALSNTPIQDQRICSVDLGINTDAVCSIMESDGTVLLRKFIDFPSDKDYLRHELNRLKKFQRQNGSRNAGSRWSSIKRHNIEHGRKVGKAIADFAASYNCDVIVFEHLDTGGYKIKGSKKQRLHLWRKNAIQDVASTRAHLYGMRISRICAWGTSKLAYDGSGVLERDPKNHQLATFQNGKHYNADLSASYNIGARYFIREMLKPLSVKIRSQLLAKVPEAEHRTSCTYHTLLDFSKELKALTA